MRGHAWPPLHAPKRDNKRGNEMSMYYETAEDVMISKERAFQEIKNHNLESEFDLFLQDCGDQSEYDAQTVLTWLGY